MQLITQKTKFAQASNSLESLERKKYARYEKGDNLTENVRCNSI